MKPKVLFLCTGNSARSQMAEGYLRHVANDKYEAVSAGIEPKGLNPLAVEVMREIGIDISQQQSKDAATFLGTHTSLVITVCDHAKERCPVFPGAFKFLHWGFPDPAAISGSPDGKLAAFRSVRDGLIKKIQEELLAETARRA
jgi:arsenate reductase